MAKIVDRLLITIYSLAVLAASCCALAAAFGLIPFADASGFLQAVYDEPYTAGVWIAGFIIALLISIRLLYIALRPGRGQAPSINRRTDYGDIRISLDTVENLSLKAASRIRGTKDVKARIRVTGAGLEIVIRTLVDGESSIPAMTEQIQSTVKAHIEEVTGIPVAAVSVYVANIAQSAVSFSSRVE